MIHDIAVETEDSLEKKDVLFCGGLLPGRTNRGAWKLVNIPPSNKWANKRADKGQIKGR